MSMHVSNTLKFTHFNIEYSLLLLLVDVGDKQSHAQPVNTISPTHS